MAMEDTLAKADKVVERMKKTPKDAGKTMSYLDELWKARHDNQDFKDLLSLGMESVPKKFRSIFLGAMPLDQLKQSALQLPNKMFGNKMDTIVDDLRGMLAKRNAMLLEAAEIAAPWETLTRKNPAMAQLLAKVMHFSSINHIDPSTEAGRAVSPTLAAMWDSLRDTPGAHDIYRNARDYYAKQFNAYVQLLVDNINNSGLDKEAKKKTIDALKLTFEGKAQLVIDSAGNYSYIPDPNQTPYFPLMREGPYWFKSGSGKGFE
jgi:hypothetical protein